MLLLSDLTHFVKSSYSLEVVGLASDKMRKGNSPFLTCGGLFEKLSCDMTDVEQLFDQAYKNDFI